MTRIAPLLTLLAVAVLGGALFVVNTMQAQAPTAAAAAPANTAASAPAAEAPPAPGAEPAAPAAAPAAEPPAAEGAGGHDLDLSGVDVAGAAPADAEAPAPAPAAGAEGGAEGGAEDEKPAPAATPDNLFAGKSADGSLTVAIGVNGNDAAAEVSDGETTFSLAGTATRNGLALKDRTGKVKLDGDIDGNTFNGTVTVNGEKRRYSADGTTEAQAKRAGQAGVGRVAAEVGR